jgi:hypothetical protein
LEQSPDRRQGRYPTHENWEYKFISWSYGFEGPSVGGYTSWKEDGRDLPLVDGKADLGGKIQALGLQGWELVSDTPYSRHMNVSPENHVAANGVSTDEMLIFKRQNISCTSHVVTKVDES